MFLKHPVPGQMPGKKQKAKKRKAPEELRESDRDYEKKRTRKFQPQWRDRWNWLGYDEEKKEVYFANYAGRCPRFQTSKLEKS